MIDYKKFNVIGFSVHLSQNMRISIIKMYILMLKVSKKKNLIS
jgi:hypothetical protein